MNVELVTDERRPRLLWRGTLRKFLSMKLPEADGLPIEATLARGDEIALYRNGERKWLRLDIGERHPIQPQTEAKS